MWITHYLKMVLFQLVFSIYCKICITCTFRMKQKSFMEILIFRQINLLCYLHLKYLRFLLSNCRNFVHGLHIIRHCRHNSCQRSCIIAKRNDIISDILLNRINQISCGRDIESVLQRFPTSSMPYSPSIFLSNDSLSVIAVAFMPIRARLVTLLSSEISKKKTAIPSIKSMAVFIIIDLFRITRKFSLLPKFSYSLPSIR